MTNAFKFGVSLLCRASFPATLEESGEPCIVEVTVDWLDSLTVYKDRRPYPHKLANAILAYGLEDKVQNSHRAIDDVLALFEVLKAMDAERDDLASYVNLFGYNPKYGVSGRRIVGVRYLVPLRVLPARAGVRA